jgi:hypothetical protein
MKPFKEIAKEANVELTPEISHLMWLVNHYALISFWESAKRQMEYQQKVLESAQKNVFNKGNT